MNTLSKLTITGIGLLFILSSQLSEVQLPIFEVEVFTPESLVMIEENSLLATTKPFNPEPQVVQKVSVIVTAYSSTVWQCDSDPFITASGAMVRDGIVASNLLPFGTEIRIPELYGWSDVTDKTFAPINGLDHYTAYANSTVVYDYIYSIIKQ